MHTQSNPSATQHRIKTAASLVCAALVLSACVVAPLPPQRQVVYTTYPTYEQPPPDGTVYSAVPPPAQQVEIVPVRPFANAVWIGGHWGWAGGRHQWISGHYTRPVPGYRFAPRRWEPVGGRWVLRGGFWVR